MTPQMEPIGRNVAKYWRLPVAAIVAFAYGWAEGKKIRQFTEFLTKWAFEPIDGCDEH
jgi:hypothetical protein